MIASLLVCLVALSGGPSVLHDRAVLCCGVPSNDGASERSGTVTSPLGPPPSAIGTPLQAWSGVATWYATCDRCAAAGPVLRRGLGKGWRGSWVTVSSGGRSVTVKLTDWCQCRDRHGEPTLLDLSDSAFGQLAPLGSGVVGVVVATADTSLPQTDTAE